MKVRLIRQVLVGNADTMATPKGSSVDIDDATAKDWIERGIAEEDGGHKKAAEPANKMAAAPKNKARK